ncbi:MAG: hypothetical protein WCX64_04780 [Candidatus Micrarchaeia archaeon]|jgi:hypothetical protein
MTLAQPVVATILELKQRNDAYKYYDAPEIAQQLLRKQIDVEFKALQAQKNSSNISNGQMP